ncbi:MAG: single-stranded DNA-binding protein [Prevotellaceae bacterium]|jgi:single-strand DNA-binding protein|nr:single-stranded DNA-binding protein [Prevotellaceae bacterium]
MSVNKVILVGNVGRDPEVRYLERNVAVANFTLATTERGYTMQNGTQVPERTEWHNIVAWRGLAELAEKYIRKGRQLYIEGKIQSRSWEKDGIKRYTTEIYAETIQMLGNRPETIEPLSTQPTYATGVSSSHQPAAPQQPMQNQADRFEDGGNPEDDLPF